MESKANSKKVVFGVAIAMVLAAILEFIDMAVSNPVLDFVSQ